MPNFLFFSKYINCVALYYLNHKIAIATVFILGDRILSPIHFEYKTFSKGYLVDEVFSNPLNRFLTLQKADVFD